MYIFTHIFTNIYMYTSTYLFMHICINSREKRRKCISVTGSLRGQAQVQPIDKLDKACTNADDWMILVQHRSGDRFIS